jgi:DNA-binding SARP family transcriptional activator
MYFRLLGPLEVVEQDRAVVLGGVEQRSLLAILLLHANEVVGTDRLIGELLGESPPDDPRTRFRSSLTAP